MHYQFFDDACACFVVWETEPWNDCSNPEEPMINPLQSSMFMSDFCISESDFMLIFQHTLGQDCIAGTSDDTTGNQADNESD